MSTVTADSWPGPGEDAETPVPPPTPLMSTCSSGSAGRCGHPVPILGASPQSVSLGGGAGCRTTLEAWLAGSRDVDWGAGSLPSPHAPSTHIRGEM